MTFAYWIGAYALIFLIMFADFYRKAYKKPKAIKNNNTHTENGIHKTE